MRTNRSANFAIAALLAATSGLSATALAQQQGRDPQNDQQQGDQQDQDGDNNKKKRGNNQKDQNHQNDQNQKSSDRPAFQMGPGKKPGVVHQQDNQGQDRQGRGNDQKGQNSQNQKGSDRPVFQIGPGKKPGVVYPQDNQADKKPQDRQDDQPSFKKARDQNDNRDRKNQDNNGQSSTRDNNTRDSRDRNWRDEKNPQVFTPPGTKNVTKDGNPPRIRVTPTGVPTGLEELKRKRVQKVEDGGKRVVIEEPDKRVIVKQDNRMVIQRDETSRIKLVAPNARFERRGDKTISVVDRPGGVKVISETDANGQLVRRYRRGNDGREYTIVDNRYSDRRRRKDKFGRNIAIGAGVGIGIVAGAAILDSIVNVPPPRVRIPRDKYIVDYERASDDDIYEALSAPPVDNYSDRYTLNEIRATQRLRERMRRVDLDDITFEFGSWEVDPSQYRKLDRIARAMLRVIERDPNEVFLIEGYTDAVGTREDNLTLSDRRAESVAVILSEQFQVPFENLTTQGYGEDYLKIPTLAPERANRRVAARRITPLLARDDRRSDDRGDEGRDESRDDGRYDDRGDGRNDDRGYDDRDGGRDDDRGDGPYDDRPR